MNNISYICSITASILNMRDRGSSYVYILSRSTSGRLHTCMNLNFREDWVKIGKSLLQ